MSDWSHIPLHIRCTERWKIDPSYPKDDATWWRLEEASKRGTTYGPIAKNKGKSERQKRLIAYIEEHGVVSTKDMRRDLGYTESDIKHIINGITLASPVYEESINHMLRYGIGNLRD